MKVYIGRYPKGEQERKVRIRIDKWDTWNMDHTLALIIVPMLEQLQATKHGSPRVDDEDVPEHLKSTAPGARDNCEEWESDNNLHLRWDWVINEILWAMQQIASDGNEDQFYDHSEVDESESLMMQVKKMKIDREGLKAHQDRVQNGCRLFGKYFQALWD